MPEFIAPRRVEEFKGVFHFLDKDDNNRLEMQEMRYIMDATGNACSDDDLRELIEDVAGGSVPNVEVVGPDKDGGRDLVGKKMFATKDKENDAYMVDGKRFPSSSIKQIDPSVDEKAFLSFCQKQLQEDPREEIRETWSVVSKVTKYEEKYDKLADKELPNIDVPDTVEKSTDKRLGLVSPNDIMQFMKKLGEDMFVEEARELIMQTDKHGKDALLFEEFVQLLNVPPGGELNAKTIRKK